jgi:hypothetical protein
MEEEMNSKQLADEKIAEALKAIEIAEGLLDNAFYDLIRVAGIKTETAMLQVALDAAKQARKGLKARKDFDLDDIEKERLKRLRFWSDSR